MDCFVAYVILRVPTRSRATQRIDDLLGLDHLIGLDHLVGVEGAPEAYPGYLLNFPTTFLTLVFDRYIHTLVCIVEFSRARLWNMHSLCYSVVRVQRTVINVNLDTTPMV